MFLNQPAYKSHATKLSLMASPTRIAATAALAPPPQGDSTLDTWGNRLHSFCIGLPGSPDLKAAREVAAFLGTDHHEFTFTVQVRAHCK